MERLRGSSWRWLWSRRAGAARASIKNFRLKDGGDEPAAPGRNSERNFHGEKRSNKTHASTTDPDARPARPHNENHGRIRKSLVGPALYKPLEPPLIGSGP